MRCRTIEKTGLSLLAASLLSLAIPTDLTAAVLYTEQGNDRYEETWEDDDREYTDDYGPGVPSVPAAELTEQGPEVVKVTLRERYHEAFDLYEESLQDIAFLYSNVSNGGITDRPSYLEIPLNVSVQAEKDGAPIEYVSGQRVSAYGTYVFRISVIEDTTVPLHEQKEYQTTFRFRIHEKVIKEPEQPEDVVEVGKNIFRPAGGGTVQSREAEDGMAVLTAGDEAVDPDEALPEQDAAEASGAAGNAEESGASEESETAGESGEAEAAGVSEAQLRTQVYRNSNKDYEVTLENGASFYSTVPEGMITSQPVRLSMENNENFTLYCDDEAIPYTSGANLAESGWYRLVMDDYAFHFAIVSQVRELDIYPAPSGMEFISATCDEEEADIHGGRYVRLEQDGTYEFLLKGNAENLITASFCKDNQPPEFELRISGGKAEMVYHSDDIASAVLYKGGSEVKNFNGKIVDKPGNYRLEVTDQAGNTSSREFQLKYAINVYGILAIVLMLAVIGGGVLFVVRIKKKVDVR